MSFYTDFVIHNISSIFMDMQKSKFIPYGWHKIIQIRSQFCLLPKKVNSFLCQH